MEAEELYELRKKIIYLEKKLKEYREEWNNRQYKLPSELNVIFVSMERCGISWIIRNLSRIHEYMFGVGIDFIPEISPIVATRNRLLLHKGYCNVYNVNPLDLLNKKDPNGEQYDRVIIIKRDKKILKLVHEFWYPPDIPEVIREKFRKDFDKNYDLVYGHEIHDPRCIEFDLDDFNNYTVSTFNELMDFLNFPKERRPILIVVPIARDWEAFSSILNRGHELCKNLKEVSKYLKVTKEGLLKFLVKEKHGHYKDD